MSANWVFWFYVVNGLPGAVGLYSYSFEIWHCVVLNLLVLATGSIAGLACVWAGLGRPHWFWRMAAVTVVASLALLISAHELVIWFFAQAVVTIPPLLIVRRYKARHASAKAAAPDENKPTPRRWLQWSLRDQLLWCILLSGILAMAVQIPSTAWESWVWPALLGLMFGLSTLVGTWAAFGKRRLRLAAICLLPPSVIIAAWLGLFKTIRRSNLTRPSRLWAVRIRTAVLLLYSLLLLLLPTALFCPLIYPVPIPVLAEQPSPNGLDDLVQAGEAAGSALAALTSAGKMSSMFWGDPSTASDMELRGLASANAETLALARSGLGKPCQVPFSCPYPITVNRRYALYGLARAFWAEGELAEREGRMTDATQSYLDSIRTGYGMSRGGLMSDWFTGGVILVSGAERVHNIRFELESNHCVELANRVYELDIEAEPWTDIRNRNAAYEYLRGGWQSRVLSRIDGSERLLRDNHRSVHAKTRLVTCSLALQAYHLDHDAWPGSLDDLVPEYLPEVPEDPFIGEPVVYHCDGPGYQLYCLPPETAGWDDERRSAFNFSYDGSNE